MELEEEEAQICRLCGQCESIYIDVFGEEGTKRFLGLKIHTKINILIDERDPLPKAICVQCLGKLEFVCDFQEECLRTQQVLRDRFNLPPLKETAGLKTEETPPSTSSNNNNNIDKNLNPLSEENNSDVELQVVRTMTRTSKNLRSQQAKSQGDSAKDQSNVQTPSEQSTETSSPASGSENSTETTPTIQIPTSALNKLLTVVSNSPNIEVSVKESRSHSNDTEDISFTVELSKKESDDVSVVQAKVFPDQGSCMVDKSIISLLQNQNCLEVNSIINTIVNNSTKSNSPSKSREAGEYDPKWNSTKNPEELFKIDGEEIRVDDNVEQVVSETQNGYACKLCRKFYERKDKCMVHVKTHLGIKQYSCILCNAKFVCKSDVMKHIRCSHTNPRPIQCPKCPKRFKSKFYLTEHDNVHKGVRPYSCTDCGQSYHHKVSLQIHMKSHLPPQNLACEYCGKVFPYRTRLLSHVTSVHLKNRRNFRCRFCYNLYSSLSVLNEHIKTRHATTYTCEECNKTFKVASKYKAHVLQHTNPKPFACKICNNRYASKAFLNEHLLKHEGLRKHVCQSCGASFAQASHLAAHRHVHGEKNHTCPECGRKFNRRDNMKVHRKRHFEEKKTGYNEKNTSTTDISSAAANEKIEQNDGLPQAVCINCLGRLEFLCDFYDQCHRTRQELETKKSRVISAAAALMDESNVLFDKENVPPPKERKRKIGTVTVNKIRTTKASFYNNSNKSRITKKVKNSETTTKNLAGQIKTRAITHSSNSIENPVSDRVLRVRKLSENQNISNVPKIRKSVEKAIDGNAKRLTRTTRSGTMNGTASLSQNSVNSKNLEAMNLELPLKRKKCGRKSMLEQMLDLNHSLNAMIKHDESQTSAKDKPSQEGFTVIKRRRLRSSTSSTESSSKEQNKSLRESTNRIVSKNSPSASNKTDIDDKASLKLIDPEKSDSFFEKEGSAAKKPGTVVIKQEKIDSNDASLDEPVQSSPLSSFVWIPKDALLVEGTKPKSQTGVANGVTSSPPPGDEAEKTKINGNSAPTVLENTKPLQGSTCDMQSSIGISNSAKPNQMAVTISSQNKDIIVPKIQDEDCKEVEEITSSMNATKNCFDSSINSDRSFSEEVSQNGSFKEHKNKSVLFGKVSDLISKEDKLVIESCYTVDMSRVNAEKVQSHLKIVDKNIRCNICGSLYARVDKCQIHIWGHLNMKPYQCKVCDFSTVTVSNVRGHIRKSHLKIKPFACHQCDKRFVTAVLLEEHLNTHTGNRPYQCKLCDFSCASRPLLRYHNARHKTMKDIVCKVCEKAFYTRDRLRAHMITHNKDKVVMCKLCSSYLSSAEALEQHYKNVHTRDYVCNICGKHTRSRKALYNHRNVHSAAKYKCTLCPNVYKSSQILKEHLLKHEGIRKYKCTVCEKCFAQQSHLAAHMAVHSSIRFNCPGCNKGFNRHDNMKIHTKRCKEFIAKPELQGVLLRRQRSSSQNSTGHYVKTEGSGEALKDNNESNKTDSDSLREVEECTKESMDIARGQNKAIENSEMIRKSPDLDVMCIDDDVEIVEQDEVVILENVLRMENF